MKNNLQFVHENTIHINSKSDFFKLNSQNNSNNVDGEKNENSELKIKLSDWEKKPAKCRIV